MPYERAYRRGKHHGVVECTDIVLACSSIEEAQERLRKFEDSTEDWRNSYRLAEVEG